MILPEPLWDLAGRTLNHDADVTGTIEKLLRLQNAADHQRPITLYVVGTPAAPMCSPTDALLLCALIRMLRSPVQTVGMGLLQSSQALVLAAGTYRRFLLRHSFISLAPIPWHSVALSRTPIGLGSKLSTTQEILDAQIQMLLAELKLAPDLFLSERLLTAEAAVQHKLADLVVVQPLQQFTPAREFTYEAKH
jgi:hypothetical protein